MLWGSPVRTLATSAMNIFDRNAKRLQRDRAVLRPDVTQCEHVRNEIAWYVCDRVNDISRDFGLALDLGCGRGHVGQHIDRESVKELVQCDLSGNMLAAFDENARDQHLRVQADEEFLPFANDTFELVVSNLSLHWVNDLPGTLRQIKNVLRQDGVFIGSMFGGDTLYELRGSLQLAEQERLGGFGLHMSPLVNVRDVGGLLAEAGFSLLTVDVDEITVGFPSMYELLDDLKGMAETNAAITRPGFLRRDVLEAAAGIYSAMYGNEDGSVPATFQVVHMVGWKPHPKQPKSKERGSADSSFKDLGTTLQEQPTYNMFHDLATDPPRV